MTSAGESVSDVVPNIVRTSGVNGMDFSDRAKIPPPFEITLRS